MNRKLFCVACAAIVVGALSIGASKAKADLEDQLTQFTFQQPVRVPGYVVLPAGTYWFQKGNGGDSAMNAPQVVHVYNADHSKLLASFMAFDTIRPGGDAGRWGITPDTDIDHGLLKIAEGSKNQPIALMAWYYPGHYTGEEFLYSANTRSRLDEERQIMVTPQNGQVSYSR